MKKLDNLLIAVDKDELRKFWSCYTSETLKNHMSPSFARRLPDAGYEIVAVFNGVTVCTKSENLTDAVFDCIQYLVEHSR